MDDTLEDPQPPPKSERNIPSSASVSASITKTGQARDIVDGWEPPSYAHARNEKEIENIKLNDPIPLAVSSNPC